MKAALLLIFSCLAHMTAMKVEALYIFVDVFVSVFFFFFLGALAIAF